MKLEPSSEVIADFLTFFKWNTTNRKQGYMINKEVIGTWQKFLKSCKL